MEKENLIKIIHYKTGYDDPKEANKEYFDLENKLKEEGKRISGGWEGDFLVSVFEMNNKIYKVSDDMEFHIPYSIEIYKKENFLMECPDDRCPICWFSNIDSLKKENCDFCEEHENEME